MLDYYYCGTCFRELLLLLLLSWLLNAFPAWLETQFRPPASFLFSARLFSLCLLVMVVGKGIEINEWQLLVYIVRGLWLIKQISEADNRKERSRGFASDLWAENCPDFLLKSSSIKKENPLLPIFSLYRYYSSVSKSLSPSKLFLFLEYYSCYANFLQNPI